MFSWLWNILLWLPVKILAKSTSIPPDPVAVHKIDLGNPIVYVTETASTVDLLALHFCLKTLTLPSPFKPLRIRGTWVRRKLHIYRTPFFFNSKSKRSKRCYSTFCQWEKIQKENPDLKIQIITVPSIWGRAPKERSASGKSRSALKKLWALFVHGYNHAVFVSRPVSVAELLARLNPAGRDDEKRAELLERFAGLYFRRTGAVSGGSKLPERDELMQKLLSSENVIEAVKEESETEGTNSKKASVRARKIAYEISADVSYGVLGLFNRIFDCVWSKLYSGISVSGDDPVRELSRSGHEIVYVPCHRSHTDYLLLTYVAYNAGLMPPHVASGINLNFWPLGPIIRRAGAFFLRRKFNGDKLYTTIFREYVSLLCSERLSLEFFIEGTRSRTGLLLPPKTGMLSMLVQNQLRNPDHPIAIVPVYLSYEHVLEIDAYTKELSGIRKQAENIWQLFGIFGKLRNCGRTYVHFGKPVSVTRFLDQSSSDWRETCDPLGRFRPSWMFDCVTRLSEQVMHNMAAAASVNGFTLCATLLLAAGPGKPPSSDELIEGVEILNNILKYSQKGGSIAAVGTGEQLVEEALSLGQFEFTEYRGIKRIVVLYKQYLRLTYYRNNTLHLFAVPALILKMIAKSDRLAYDEICRYVFMTFGLLKSAFTVPVEEEGLEQYIRHMLVAMEKTGLIDNLNGSYRICPQKEKFALVIASISDNILIKLATLLFCAEVKPFISYDELLESWQRELKRFRYDNRWPTAPEFYDPNVLRQFVNCLQREHYLRAVNTDGLLRFDMEALHEMYMFVMEIIESEVRDNLASRTVDMM